MPFQYEANSNTKKPVISLNDTIRIITGCVKPTHTHLFHVLSGIAPTKLRKNFVINKIFYHSWANKEHQLHSLVLDPQSLRIHRLKARHPFYGHAAEHHSCDHETIEALKEEGTKYQLPKHLTLTLDTTAPPGSDLPWKLWITLNCLRAGFGQLGAELHKWGLRTSASCACGATTQNAEHILFDCFDLIRAHNTVKNLTNVTDDTKNWLQHLAENLR